MSRYVDKTAPSMEPQPFCSLPWCGKAPGGAEKVRVVDGQRLTYPERMDAHHPHGRPGPVIYVCHDYHTAHHDGRFRFDAAYLDGRWLASAGADTWLACVIAQPWDLEAS